MSANDYSLDELARQLGRDRRELEKLVSRGRIPGRKVGGVWQFHQREITQWLEREMRAYSERELAVVEESHRSTEAHPDVPVSSLLNREFVAVPLLARTKRSVLESLVELAGKTWQVWEPSVVLEAVQQREALLTTGFEGGFAFPHPRNPLPDSLGESLIAFGRTMTGIPFGASNGQLTDLFFLVLCRDSRTHLQVLARLGRIVRSPGFLDDIRQAADSESAYQIVCACDEKIGAEKI